MADLILLQTILAGYAALLQTVQTWRETKDRHAALVAYRIALTRASSDPKISDSARTISPFVPQDVAALIQRRFNNCWTEYHRILDPANGAQDKDLDAAETNMIKCACREAKRLYDLCGGELPPGPLLDFWEKHKCWEHVD